MTFAQIPLGERLFLDANPLVYFFNADPTYGAACQILMTRIEHQEIAAFTTTQELSDVAHRVMCYEAMQRFGWSTQGLVAKLKTHPTELRQLIRFRQAVEAILSSSIQVLTIPPAMILTAADLSVQDGLLSNDSLIPACMQAHGLTSIASADADFDRVPSVRRYGPV